MILHPLLLQIGGALLACGILIMGSVILYGLFVWIRMMLKNREWLGFASILAGLLIGFGVILLEASVKH